MISLENVQITDSPMHLAENPLGVALHVFGIPDEHGVGGTGQTAMDFAIGHWLRQRIFHDTGANMRYILGEEQGLGRPLNDEEFGERLQVGWDSNFDVQLDTMAAQFPVKRLQTYIRGKRRTGVSMATKILHCLMFNGESFTEELRDRVHIVNIGVFAREEVAIRRKAMAAKRKAENAHLTDHILMKKAAIDRRVRLHGDKEKYKAYGIEYCKETMRDSANILVDNSEDLSWNAQLVRAYLIIELTSNHFPHTSQFLAQYL